MGDPLHPDWYPDPENTGLLRWWDGSKWTRQTRPASPRDAGPGSAFGPAAAFSTSGTPGPAGAPRPRDPGSPGGVQGSAAGTGGPHAVQVPPGPRLPPVGQLAQPAYETAETRRGSRRWWLIGGGIGVVVLAAAAAVALGLIGVFGKPGAAVRRTQPSPVSASSPQQAASPVPTPVALGAEVVDHRAGIGFRIPAGPGWQSTPPGALGRWTLGYRKFAQHTQTPTGSRATIWAEVESEPLPSSVRYTGPGDLRSDGVQVADELAIGRYAEAHTVKQLGVTREGANGRGGARYVIDFRVYYPAHAGRGRVTSETAAVVIAGRGTGQRPAVLFLTVPDTMDVSLVPRIAGSAAAVR